MNKTELHNHIRLFLERHKDHIKNDDWTIMTSGLGNLTFRNKKLFTDADERYSVIFFNRSDEILNNMAKSGFILNENQTIIGFDIDVYNANKDYWSAKDLNLL